MITQKMLEKAEPRYVRVSGKRRRMEKGLERRRHASTRGYMDSRLRIALSGNVRIQGFRHFQSSHSKFA